MRFDPTLADHVETLDPVGPRAVIPAAGEVYEERVIQIGGRQVHRAYGVALAMAVGVCLFLTIALLADRSQAAPPPATAATASTTGPTSVATAPGIAGPPPVAEQLVVGDGVIAIVARVPPGATQVEATVDVGEILIGRAILPVVDSQARGSVAVFATGRDFRARLTLRVSPGSPATTEWLALRPARPVQLWLAERWFEPKAAVVHITGSAALSVDGMRVFVTDVEGMPLGESSIGSGPPADPRLEAGATMMGRTAFDACIGVAPSKAVGGLQVVLRWEDGETGDSGFVVATPTLVAPPAR